MNVSPDFSLPIRVVAPYFIGAIVFNMAAMMSLLGIDPSVSPDDYRVLGWVHLYLIGFVMMTIIGAMGQMSVVVGEVYHAYPKVFGWIFPLLAAGTVALGTGFYADPVLMMIGGIFLLGAMGLFAFDLFFTLRRSRRRTAVIRSMQWSTFFLLFGLILGLAMASAYGGILPFEPVLLRKAHLFALIGGYVMINIMGVSTVLLPMFGACERPSDNDYTVGFAAMSASVVMMIASVRFEWLSAGAFALAVGSVAFYMFRVYRIFTSRHRSYSDIWERSVAAAFIALFIALILAGYGYAREDETGMMAAFWFFAAGFLGFLISAHLYKIVPFLVWFERFAPLIEERSVPSIHELLPKRRAEVQWVLASAGVVGAGMGILGGIPFLVTAGVFLEAVSAAVLLSTMIHILMNKGEKE